MKIEKTEIVYNRFLKIRRGTIQLPSGKLIDYNYIDNPDVVMVIPLTGEEIVCLKQYRFPVHSVVYDLPAGAVDEGETLEDAANRELEEEAGHHAGKLQYIHSLYPSAGSSRVQLHVYLGTELEERERKPEPTEIIEVIRMPIKDFENLLQKEIMDASITAGYYIAKSRGLLLG